MPKTMRFLTNMTKSERDSFTKERSEILRAQHARKKEELHSTSKVESGGGKEVEDIIIAPTHSIGGRLMNSISKKSCPLVTAAAASASASPQHQGTDMKTTNRLVPLMEKQHREEGSTTVSSQHLEGATGAASRLLEIPPLVAHIRSLPPERWPPIRLSQYLQSHGAEEENTVMDDGSAAKASSRTCTADVTATDPFERADRGVNRSIRRYKERKRRPDAEVEEPRHHFKQQCHR